MFIAIELGTVLLLVAVLSLCLTALFVAGVCVWRVGKYSFVWAQSTVMKRMQKALF
jgi:hypothetical protein